jgi:hypothetical protein
MNGVITTILNGQLKKDGLSRFTQTNANLMVNGLMVDLSFVVPAGYSDDWDFTKYCYVNLTKRIGAGDGGSVALLNNVRLFDLLCYSDFIAGVSMSGTKFEEGELVRISGYVDLGFFVMSSRDALEVSLNISDISKMPSNSVNFEISSVFDKVEVPNYIVYQSSLPTGADQPYKDVLSLYYIGKGQNADVSVTDQTGNKNININSAIALSNSRGEFEFFTDFGELYHDVFELSQDLSFRCPLSQNDVSLLVKSYAFYPQETVDGLADMVASRDSLLEKIKNNDKQKYQYLQDLGIA